MYPSGVFPQFSEGDEYAPTVPDNAKHAYPGGVGLQYNDEVKLLRFSQKGARRGAWARVTFLKRAGASQARRAHSVSLHAYLLHLSHPVRHLPCLVFAAIG